MAEASDYIRQRIESTIRELNTANTKAQEFERRALDLRSKAAELEIVVKHLTEWGVEMGLALQDATMRRGMDHDTTISAPIRSIVGNILRDVREFSRQELIGMVLAINGGANPNSVHAEITHRKKRGDVELTSVGRYKSLLFESPSDVDPNKSHNLETSIATGGSKGEQQIIGELHGRPGPEFGRIQQHI